MPRGARRKHRDAYNDDYPSDLDEVGDPGKVEFNFRIPISEGIPHPME